MIQNTLQKIIDGTLGNKRLPLCPGCQKTCSKEKTSFLFKQLEQYFESHPELVKLLFGLDIDSAYNYFTSHINRWACDDCINSGVAIPATVEGQTFCIWQPHFAYVDQIKECRTCKEEFVFSKFEQQFWYDTLNFWVVSDAINCKECRHQLRVRKEIIRSAQREISKFKNQFDPSNPEHLTKMIGFYELTESWNVVKKYKSQLDKLLKN